MSKSSGTSFGVYQLLSWQVGPLLCRRSCSSAVRSSVSAAERLAVTLIICILIIHIYVGFHRGRNGFKVGGAKHFFDKAKYILVLLIKCTKCMHASVIKRNKMLCN